MQIEEIDGWQDSQESLRFEQAQNMANNGDHPGRYNGADQYINASGKPGLMKKIKGMGK